MKDNRCRIIIKDVYCESARCGAYEWPHVPVSDYYPPSQGFKITALNETRYTQLMISLRTNLQSIVDAYKVYMKKPLIIETDW